MNYYRFPIDLIDDEVKKNYDLIGESPTEDDYFESWVDIREDQIVAIRPFIPKDSKDGEIKGTFIYLNNGDAYVVNVLPSVVKNVLEYSLIKLKSCKHDSI